MLAPCDGPPPDAGVTPLGNSIPTAANGSVAPLAPDPSAALRTIRALRDEDFDVLHLHEPLAPGATMTAALFSNGPMVGTFHAAGDSAAYRWLMPLTRWVAKRLTDGARCPRTRASLRTRHSGASTACSSTASRSISTRRLRPRRPTVRRSSSSGVTSRARASTCCSKRWRACLRTRACGSAATGPDTAELQGTLRGRHPHRVARAAHRRGEGRAAAGRGRVLRAVAAGRVVRGGAARGDGGRHAGRRQRPPRLPQRRDRRPRRAAGARRRPGTARFGAPAGARPIGHSRRDCPRLATPGPGSSRWTRSPRPTSGSTTHAIEAHAVRSR